MLLISFRHIIAFFVTYVVRRVIGVYLCSDLQTFSSRPVLGREPLWAVAFIGIGG